jgi:hypothetical protein
MKELKNRKTDAYGDSNPNWKGTADATLLSEHEHATITEPFSEDESQTIFFENTQPNVMHVA